MVLLEAARRGTREAEAIELRKKQWQDKLDGLLAAQQRAGWLEIDLLQVDTFPELVNRTRELAQEAVTRLAAHPDTEVLTKEDLWASLLQTAQNAADTALAEVKLNWSERVDHFHQLTPTQQLRTTASALPQNKERLAEYELQYQAASLLAAIAVPKSANNAQALSAAIVGCRLIASELCFDAPQEVDEFFRAVNAGGASLALVTPTVLTWLEENDQLGGYTVRASTL
jgi:hypothetical protein